jgi:hypothetical protein
MKKLFAVLFRLLIFFLISEFFLLTIWMAESLIQAVPDDFFVLLQGMAVAAVPGAMLAAIFGTFFLLNRLFSSRLAGFILLTIFSAVLVSGISVLIRYLDMGRAPNISVIPAEYRPVAAWFADTSRVGWLEFAGATCSFAAFVSAFWGCTRLSRTRPLVGAFIAPGTALGALYLFSLFQSGPVDAAFSFVGLNLSRISTTSILSSVSAIALLLADALLALKPNGGSTDA